MTAQTPPPAAERAFIQAAVDHLARDVRQGERRPGVDRIWLPGEQSAERRTRYGQTGLPMPDALIADFNTLAGELAIAPLTATKAA